MHEKELILLDATVTAVIHTRAFRAVLDNGHDLVAVACIENGERASRLVKGDRVRVRFSPFDFSQGQLVFEGSDS